MALAYGGHRRQRADRPRRRLRSCSPDSGDLPAIRRSAKGECHTTRCTRSTCSRGVTECRVARRRPIPLVIKASCRVLRFTTEVPEPRGMRRCRADPAMRSGNCDRAVGFFEIATSTASDWRCATPTPRRSTPIATRIERRRLPGSRTASPLSHATRRASCSSNASLSFASLPICRAEWRLVAGGEVGTRGAVANGLPKKPLSPRPCTG
jgi:hypothetical protein